MKYLSTITGLFVAVLLISGIASTKIIQLGPLSFDGGTLLFPLSYIFGDVLTEVYGYQQTRKTIRTGLLAMVLMSVTVRIVGVLPPAADRPYQSDYSHILMLTPRIFVASIIAYRAGEFINSYLLARMKIRTEGKALRQRTIGSTLVGQIVDTGLFVVIAFAGVMSRPVIWTIMISNYIFKVLVEVLFTPVTYRIVAFLKQQEQSDVYDTHTNFNPFALGGK